MIAIAITSWFLYAVALTLKAYTNRIQFMAKIEMPLAFSRSSRFQVKLRFFRLAVTYGSLIGIWLAHGIPTQVVAFLFYLVFSVFTFVHGSRRSVKKWARVDFDRLKSEAHESGGDFEEDVAWFRANKRGEEIVGENIRANGDF